MPIGSANTLPGSASIGTRAGRDGEPERFVRRTGIPHAKGDQGHPRSRDEYPWRTTVRVPPYSSALNPVNPVNPVKIPPHRTSTWIVSESMSVVRDRRQDSGYAWVFDRIYRIEAVSCGPPMAGLGPPANEPRSMFHPLSADDGRFRRCRSAPAQNTPTARDMPRPTCICGICVICR